MRGEQLVKRRQLVQVTLVDLCDHDRLETWQGALDGVHGLLPWRRSRTWAKSHTIVGGLQAVNRLAHHRDSDGSGACHDVVVEKQAIGDERDLYAAADEHLGQLVPIRAQQRLAPSQVDLLATQPHQSLRDLLHGGQGQLVLRALSTPTLAMNTAQVAYPRDLPDADERPCRQGIEGVAVHGKRTPI